MIRCTPEGHFLAVTLPTLAILPAIVCDCGALTSYTTQIQVGQEARALMDSIEDYAAAPSATASPVIKTTGIEPVTCTCGHELSEHDRTSRKMCHAPLCTCDRFEPWHGLVQEQGADR